MGEKKIIIVIGCLRTGTSLISGILRILGVDMGSRFIGPNEFNKKGYFEDLDFVDLNKEIFNYIKSNEYGNPIRERYEQAPAHFADRIQVLLKNKELATTRQAWGWKHPGTSLLLPIFLNQLHDKKVYFIYCQRNKPDVVTSLKRRGMAEDIAERTYELYNARIRASQNKLDNLVEIWFEDFIIQPRNTVQKIINFCGLTVEPKQVEKAINFVEPDLMHIKE